MPSIPQSLLWISLVVLWLFVLVPMLISKRDAVRRTSDVALATRVLNTATSSRLFKRAGPASGHRTDPDWRPSENELDEDSDDEADDDAPQRSVVVAAAVIEDTEPDYLDVDVIEEPSGALPVGKSDAGEADGGDEGGTGELTLDLEEPDENVDTAVYEVATDEYEDRRPAPPTGTSMSTTPRAWRLGGERSEGGGLADGGAATPVRLDEGRGGERPQVQVPQADAGVDDAGPGRVGDDGVRGDARRVVGLRQRRRGDADVPGLSPPSDSDRGAGAAAPMQRIARSRLGVENTDDREFDLVPSRLRRPGAVVLEIDDEDPEFEHLDSHPRPVTTTCRGRPGSNSPRIGRFLRARVDW